jgi:hypothetical protein
MVLEKRVLRKTFGPKGRKWQEVGEEYTMMGFIICMLHQILFR